MYSVCRASNGSSTDEGPGVGTRLTIGLTADDCEAVKSSVDRGMTQDVIVPSVTFEADLGDPSLGESCLVIENR